MLGKDRRCLMRYHRKDGVRTIVSSTEKVFVIMKMFRVSEYERCERGFVSPWASTCGYGLGSMWAWTGPQVDLFAYGQNCVALVVIVTVGCCICRGYTGEWGPCGCVDVTVCL